jgi:hypothetical protein
MENNLKWLCKKCNRMIDNCVDMDYHYDTVHPDFTNIYILSWYNNGKKGLSAYD